MDKKELILDSYKNAVNTRNVEEQQVISRNNFFMIFQGVLLSAALSSEHGKPLVETLISFFGIFISYFQFLMSASAKFDLECWQSKTERIEEEMKKELGELHALLFRDKEDEERVKEKYKHKGLIDRIITLNISSSKLPIYTSLTLTMLWALLFLHCIHFDDHILDWFTFHFDGYYFDP